MKLKFTKKNTKHITHMLMAIVKEETKLRAMQHREFTRHTGAKSGKIIEKFKRMGYRSL